MFDFQLKLNCFKLYKYQKLSYNRKQYIFFRLLKKKKNMKVVTYTPPPQKKNNENLKIKLQFHNLNVIAYTFINNII